MDAKDFRIGNFYSRQGVIDKIECLQVDGDFIFIDGVRQYGEEIFYPIELTEEWLVKFGFESYSKGQYTNFFKLK